MTMAVFMVSESFSPHSLSNFLTLFSQLVIASSTSWNSRTALVLATSVIDWMARAIVFRVNFLCSRCHATKPSNVVTPLFHHREIEVVIFGLRRHLLNFVHEVQHTWVHRTRGTLESMDPLVPFTRTAIEVADADSLRVGRRPVIVSLPSS